MERKEENHGGKGREGGVKEKPKKGSDNESGNGFDVQVEKAGKMRQYIIRSKETKYEAKKQLKQFLG